VATEEKSNEITAIPVLLRQLALSGCIVTIDAMGTQTKIAEQIIDQQGDYALALKDNQGNLYDEVKATFALAEKDAWEDLQEESERSVEKGHGRLEIREYWTISILTRGGKACEGLGWCEPNGASIRRSARKPATFSLVSPQ
jgi:predicted transposase YbfD/YdcC